MAKVLFVINVPIQKDHKLAKGKALSDKEIDHEDKNHNNEKIVGTDNVDAGLAEPSLVKLAPSINGVEATDSGSDVQDVKWDTGDPACEEDTGQKSSKRINVVDASGKKEESSTAGTQANSRDIIKVPSLETIDETKSSNNKEKEITNKSKPDDENVEKDEMDSKKKTGKRKNSLCFGLDSNHVDDPDTEYISFVSDGLTLLERVKAALELLDIPAVNWSHTQDNVHVGMFIAGDGVRCEEILDKLTFLDIGVIPGSSISVFPASVSIASVAREDQAEKLKLELEKEDKLAEKVSEFKKSIKSRLVVAQVVDSVKSDAVFTFDYLMLVILASMVAIMGLLEASSVSLVASMLISPLMGPIIAFVFGAVIRNKELLNVGIASESKGLALCILVGFIAGLIPAGLESAGLEWRSTEKWPTVEMAARGGFRSLPVGVLIALPSGAGVALSILGGKVGSLVGVAISASLLPPAVNAGLLWANAIIVGFIPPHTVGTSKMVFDNTSTAEVSGFRCPHFLNNDYVPIYSCNMAVESVVLGVISLLLTIVNILCIIFMGVIVLKIKEVAPIRLGQDAEKDFFAQDLKVARESYETTKGPNSAILGNRFLQEYRKFKQEIGVEDSKNIDNELNEILEDVEEGEDVKEILDKLPHRPKRWNPKPVNSSYVEDNETVARNPYHTFHGGSSKPSSPDIALGVRKRGSAFVSISPSRMEDDDKHCGSYLTTHHFFPDGFHSPRSGHRSPGRFFTKKSKGRFHVAKVEEDGHNVPKVSITPSSPSKVEIMPPIKECVPLLEIRSQEI